MGDDGQPRRLLDELLKTWPSLPVMALGLVLAWTSLAYSGSVWLSDNETDGASLSLFYIVSMVSTAVACLIGALGARRSPQLVRGDLTVRVAGCLAGAGCVIVILAGPYYLQSVSLVRSLFWPASVLAGAGMGVVSLRCGAILGQRGPRGIVLGVASAQLLAAFIYFMVFSSMFWAPVEGGPSLAGIIAFCLLPVAAAFVASMPAPPEDPAVEDGAPAGTIRGASQPLPPVFWHLLAVVFAVPFVISMTTADLIVRSDLSMTVETNTLVMLVRVILACALIVVALRIKTYSARFGRLCIELALGLAAVIALSVSLGGLRGAASVVVHVASALFELYVWCILAFVVKQRSAEPAVVFGLGRGAYVAGLVGGWVVGTYVVASIGTASLASGFYVVSALIMVAMVVAFFRQRDFDLLYTPEDPGVASIPDLIDAEQRASNARQGQFAGKRKGAFQRVVDQLSSEGMLSTRESEVFRLLAMGYGTDRVASELCVTTNTVRVHTHNLYVKLGIHSRDELMELVDSRVAELGA